jgi:hypothetical protein
MVLQFRVLKGQEAFCLGGSDVSLFANDKEIRLTFPQSHDVTLDFALTHFANNQTKGKQRGNRINQANLAQHYSPLCYQSTKGVN